MSFFFEQPVIKLPDGQFCPCIDLVSVVEAWMIKIMTNAGSQEDTEIPLGQRILETTSVNQDVHHLGHTEGVAEIVEWIVAVVFLNTQEEARKCLLLSIKIFGNLLTVSRLMCECPTPRPAPARGTSPREARASRWAPTATRQTGGS